LISVSYRPNNLNFVELERLFLMMIVMDISILLIDYTHINLIALIKS